MKLQTMLKNPQIRFKTIAEMITDYGTNWMDKMPWMEPMDALQVMTIYQGKVFYPSLIKDKMGSTLLYGPIESVVNSFMLTTKQFPKYDIRGNVLKPGMIVKIEYLAIGPMEKHFVGADLRNEPGTLVKVLKVFNPSDYLTVCDWDRDRFNKMLIAVELRNPFNGAFIDDVTRIRKPLFKDGKVCAFEIVHRVSKATDIEKEFYNKTTNHGNKS
jgi:hypothetical protein